MRSKIKTMNNYAKAKMSYRLCKWYLQYVILEYVVRIHEVQ